MFGRHTAQAGSYGGGVAVFTFSESTESYPSALVDTARLPGLTC